MLFFQTFSPLGPVISGRICEEGSVFWEISANNRLTKILTSSELLFVVFVPGDYGTVCPKACEGVVLLIESEPVHAPHSAFLSLLVFFSVTLKVEVVVLLLRQRRAIKIFHAATTLNAPHKVSIPFAEDLDRCCCKFQRAFDHLAWLVILLFEAIFEIPQVNNSVLMRCNQKRVHAWHIMNWHRQIHFG